MLSSFISAWGLLYIYHTLLLPLLLVTPSSALHTGLSLTKCFPKMGVPDNSLHTITIASCSLMFSFCLGTPNFFGKGIPKCIKCSRASFPLFHLTMSVHMPTTGHDISVFLCCKRRQEGHLQRETFSLVV